MIYTLYAVILIIQSISFWSDKKMTHEQAVKLTLMIVSANTIVTTLLLMLIK